MPEDLNAEIAEKIKPEKGREATASRHDDQTIEIAEAILIAIVAVATAWGGYQAARWDGRQAELYGESDTVRNEANQALTLGGQQRLFDITTFNTWIQARFRGQHELAALYRRRFSPEFRAAFDAWIALDPLENPNAPPGPTFMPGYRNPQIEQGRTLNVESDRLFDEGTESRQQADDYIRTTVVLATVLFLLALSQRFGVRKARLGVVVIAAVLMLYGVATILTFPRL